MSGRYHCPCGGRAWMRAELLALCSSDGERELWYSILGPDDFYCAEDDDVLLRHEAVPTEAQRRADLDHAVRILHARFGKRDGDRLLRERTCWPISAMVSLQQARRLAASDHQTG